MRDTKCYCRKGFSFIEVMVATAIMAMAFLPIAGLIKDSFHHVGDQRLEAAVATYAAEVMNEWMFVKPYNEVCIDLGDPGDKQWFTVVSDKELDDGLVVQVIVNVYETDPDDDAENHMTFEYVRIGYHSSSGCPGGAENTLIADPASVPTNLRNVNSGAADRPYPSVVDSKYVATGLPPMVTMHMTFRWRGKWEDWPVSGSTEETAWERTNTRHLICRRANLQ